jgi:hypothetical protein
LYSLDLDLILTFRSIEKHNRQRRSRENLGTRDGKINVPKLIANKNTNEFNINTNTNHSKNRA